MSSPELPELPAPRKERVVRTTARLLPWSGSEGKPCYLLTDDSRGGYVSQFADTIESVQLRMGRALVGHAQALLSDPETGASELRYLSARLAESLQDVLRVAESRGGRLLVPDTEDEGEDGAGRGPSD